MLIDIEKMRLLKTRSPEVRFNLIKKNLERFFRDYIYYYNVYDRDELVIDSGYLPYHYLDEEVINKIIHLLEKELGYAIIIVKTSNINRIGYHKDDLINIRLFDKMATKPKEVDDYFNVKLFQPLYSSFHNYYNINGSLGKASCYMSCLDVDNNILNEANEEKLLAENNEESKENNIESLDTLMETLRNFRNS